MSSSSPTCTLVITSTDAVVGGGTLATGGFTPGIPDKRSLAPPCIVNGTVMYLEILNVSLSNIANGSTSGDCNAVPGLPPNTCDSTADALSPGNSQNLHIEIDQAWKAAGTAPPDFLTDGSRIDIMGYAYWDDGHGCCWELHPLTAWKTAGLSGNKPPVVTVPGQRIARTGDFLSFAVTAVDPDPGESLTLSASGMPMGASFNAATGNFSWRPSSSQAGTFKITFSATDDGNPPLSSSEVVQIQVEGAGWCISCQIPFTLTNNIWLLAVGGVAGLVGSLTIMNFRARSRLRLARQEYARVQDRDAAVRGSSRPQ